MLRHQLRTCLRVFTCWIIRLLLSWYGSNKGWYDSNKGWYGSSKDSRTTLCKLRVNAATKDVLCKKVFLEISQNSQENTRVRVSFLMKLQTSACTHLIDFGNMKDWVDFGSTLWFWTWNPWIGTPFLNLEPLKLGFLNVKTPNLEHLNLVWTWDTGT